MNILIALGVFFYFMDKTLYPCKNKLSLKTELTHLIHNIGSITMYLGPFLIKNKMILTLILIGAGFVMVQGAVSKNRDQQCFLMPIYNRECGVDENRSLFDIMSLMGIKRLLTSEQFQYFYYIIQLLLYSIILLKVFRE
jgi:hypothetical protein